MGLTEFGPGSEMFGGESLKRFDRFSKAKVPSFLGVQKVVLNKLTWEETLLGLNPKLLMEKYLDSNGTNLKKWQFQEWFGEVDGLSKANRETQERQKVAFKVYLDPKKNRLGRSLVCEKVKGGLVPVEEREFFYLEDYGGLGVLELRFDRTGKLVGEKCFKDVNEVNDLEKRPTPWVDVEYFKNGEGDELECWEVLQDEQNEKDFSVKWLKRKVFWKDNEMTKDVIRANGMNNGSRVVREIVLDPQRNTKIDWIKWQSGDNWCVVNRIGWSDKEAGSNEFELVLKEMLWLEEVCFFNPRSKALQVRLVDLKREEDTVISVINRDFEVWRNEIREPFRSPEEGEQMRVAELFPELCMFKEEVYVVEIGVNLVFFVMGMNGKVEELVKVEKSVFYEGIPFEKRPAKYQIVTNPN